MSWPTQASKTKYHRLVAETTKINFLSVLEAGKFKINVQVDLVLDEVLAYRQPSFAGNEESIALVFKPGPHMVERKREKANSLVFLLLPFLKKYFLI